MCTQKKRERERENMYIRINKIYNTSLQDRAGEEVLEGQSFRTKWTRNSIQNGSNILSKSISILFFFGVWNL